ncbi:YhjD/YihY/BrkB family envelope integrity protein [soil metagenome]
MKRLKETFTALKKTEVGQFMSCLVRRYGASRPPILAAALAYYASFSLGPLLVLFAGGIGVFLRNRPDLSEQASVAITTLLSQMLPLEESTDILAQQGYEALEHILLDGAFFTVVFSVLVLIWAGSNFFTSLQLALEVIFESKSMRPFWRQRIIGLLLVLSVGLVISFEAISSIVLTNVEQGLEALQRSLAGFDIHPLPAIDEINLPSGVFSGGLGGLLTTAIYALSFRYMPHRGASWLSSCLGALFAVIMTVIARQLVLTFLDRDQFNIIYGVITTLMLLLLWLYLSLLLYLLGAVIAAEIDHRSEIAGESSAGEMEPLLDESELARLERDKESQAT